jgi:hypothetical protein
MVVGLLRAAGGRRGGNGVELLDNPLTVDGTLQVKATNTQAVISGGLTSGPRAPSGWRPARSSCAA